MFRLETMKTLTKKRILNLLFIAMLAVFIFVPSAKAFLIQGLMQVGLFKPAIEQPKQQAIQDLSAIKFKDAKGNTLSLADLHGKVVFLNFWATWCPPCLAEMPSVNKLHQQFKNDSEVVFILVDADSDFAKAQAYMDRKGYQLPVYNIASSIPETLFAGSLPTTVVLDKKGRLSFKEVGAANYASDKFINFINQLKALKN